MYIYNVYLHAYFHTKNLSRDVNLFRDCIVTNDLICVNGHLPSSPTAPRQSRSFTNSIYISCRFVDLLNYCYCMTNWKSSIISVCSEDFKQSTPF